MCHPIYGDAGYIESRTPEKWSLIESRTADKGVKLRVELLKKGSN